MYDRYIEELADNVGNESSHLWIKTFEGLVNAIQSFGGELTFYFLSGNKDSKAITCKFTILSCLQCKGV